jgi:hypothetical protein
MSSTPRDHPQSDEAASQLSKNYIFLFACTTIGLMIFSSASPGWVFGAAFLGAGMFAISILVAAPMFWLRFHILPASLVEKPLDEAGAALLLFIKVSVVVFGLLDIALPIGITWWAYMRLFA